MLKRLCMEILSSQGPCNSMCTDTLKPDKVRRWVGWELRDQQPLSPMAAWWDGIIHRMHSLKNACIIWIHGDSSATSWAGWGDHLTQFSTWLVSWSRWGHRAWPGTSRFQPPLRKTAESCHLIFHFNNHLLNTENEHSTKNWGEK